MRRLRQGFLPIADAGRPSDPPFGRVAAQMPGLRAQFQPAVQLEDSPVDSHRFETVRVLIVRKSLPAQLRSTSPRSDSRRRRRRHGERK